MNLRVLNSAKEPWYAGGLNFTCTACGNCCTGGPGFVWVTREEIVRVAEHLRITPAEMVERYCRRIDGRFSFKEVRTPAGLYDCVFLREHPPGAKLPDGTPLRGRGCSIYTVRPLQCRTWPFWPENLENKQAWTKAARKCHGMNAGTREFAREQIEALRDAKDWPDNPPSSDR